MFCNVLKHTEDITGMTVARSSWDSFVVGMYIPAAVVARGMGTCCVILCCGVHLMDDETSKFTLGGKDTPEVVAIPLDGS